MVKKFSLPPKKKLYLKLVLLRLALLQNIPKSPSIECLRPTEICKLKDSPL